MRKNKGSRNKTKKRSKQPRPDFKSGKIEKEPPTKKCKVEEKIEASSDESSDEDNFKSLLSSLNIPVVEQIVETDDEDDENGDNDENDRDEDGEGNCEEDDALEQSDSDVNDVNSDEGEDNCEEKDVLSEQSDSDVNDHDSSDENGNDNNSTLDYKGEDLDLNDSFDLNDLYDKDTDPFVAHFKYDLSSNLLEVVRSAPPRVQQTVEQWPVLGKLDISIPKGEGNSVVNLPKSILEDNLVYTSPGCIPNRISTVDWSKLHVKMQIHTNLATANKENLNKNNSEMTPLQKELFSIINNYQDLYFPSRSLENGEEVRFTYCLHSVNHILKTRTLVINHNSKMEERKAKDVPEEFRDQGLVRPKVLILVPFRDSAYRIIKLFMSILDFSSKGRVYNKAKFVEEFTGGELALPRVNPRPEDYERLFSGNTDDNFRIALSITRKSLKLYVDFYSADIIISSPLGLRTIIGVEGEETREYDFLASIEVLILDQTDVFLMQNWDHVLHIMENLHLQPKESHGTDFARVRSWAINGWTNFYRQTILFSSLTLPEINSLFNKKCNNYTGKVRVEKIYSKGCVCQVLVQVPQIFQKFGVGTGQLAVDCRFEYFIKKMLPQFSEAITSNVMIYVPSYFDFVRIRNYFKREDMSFVQICEYSKDGKIARARDMFFHKEAHFLLYSERSHFFRRFRIKGIRHIIFYQPPSVPHFYSELCNLIMDSKKKDVAGGESSKNITVLYSKFDCQQLAAIVGTARAARMISSERDVHMFVNGE